MAYHTVMKEKAISPFAAICSDVQRCGNSGGKVGGDGDTEKEEPRVLSREYGNWLVCLYNVEWNSGHQRWRGEDRGNRKR